MAKKKTEPIITRKALMRHYRFQARRERILVFLSGIGIAVLTIAVAALAVYFAIAGLFALLG